MSQFWCSETLHLNEYDHLVILKWWVLFTKTWVLSLGIFLIYSHFVNLSVHIPLIIVELRLISLEICYRYIGDLQMDSVITVSIRLVPEVYGYCTADPNPFVF